MKEISVCVFITLIMTHKIILNGNLTILNKIILIESVCLTSEFTKALVIHQPVDFYTSNNYRFHLKISDHKSWFIYTALID